MGCSPSKQLPPHASPTPPCVAPIQEAQPDCHTRPVEESSETSHDYTWVSYTGTWSENEDTAKVMEYARREGHKPFLEHEDKEKFYQRENDLLAEKYNFFEKFKADPPGQRFEPDVRWKQIGFNHIPTFKEYKQTFPQDGFPCYWARCHHYEVPGWPKPFVKHEKYDPAGVYGAFDRKSIIVTVREYKRLKIAKELGYFLNYGHPRYKQVRKTYLGERAKSEWASPADLILHNLWPEYYERREEELPPTSDGSGKKKKIYMVPRGEEVPDKIPNKDRYKVVGSKYPKRTIKSIIKFTIWDIKGSSKTKFANGKTDTNEEAKALKFYEDKTKEIMKMLEDGDLELPCFSIDKKDFKEKFISCHVNRWWGRGVREIDHFHVYFEEPEKDRLIMENEDTNHDKPVPSEARRRLLQSSKKHGA